MAAHFGCRFGPWFETRSSAALLTMRIEFAYLPFLLNPPRIPGRPSVEPGLRAGIDSMPGPISLTFGLRARVAGREGRFAVGSSTTASSVARRRL